MQGHKRHNPGKKGHKFNSERFFEMVRHPVTTLITGLTLVGGIIVGGLGNNKSKSENFSSGENMITAAFTPVDAMDAVLVAGYGETYQRGEHLALDVVVDTAKTSKGLHAGVTELLGEPLKAEDLYAKRVVKDTAVANDWYHKAYKGLRDELLGQKPGNFKMNKPLNKTRITSGFGARNVRGSSRASKYHMGTDFGAKPGTPVLAVMKSQLVKSKIDQNNNIGYVVMDGLHEDGRPNGFRFRYFHVVLANASKIDQVFEAGETVTTVARHHQYGHETSTGPHLHFEVQKKDPKTGKYVTLNSTQIARNDFALPGLKTAPVLQNKIGKYMAEVIKKDESGEALIALDLMLDQQLQKGSISRAEYANRKSGLQSVIGEMRQRAFAVFKQEHLQAEKMVQYTARAMDHGLPPVKERPSSIYVPYKPFGALIPMNRFYMNGFEMYHKQSKNQNNQALASFMTPMQKFGLVKHDILNPSFKPLQISEYISKRRQQILTPDS